jgi:replicative superfamily II helicase
MPDKSNDDEMDLINAEFESMVAELNLDQSSPKTYLDELEEIEASENSEIFYPPVIKRGIHGTFLHMQEAIKRWWNKPPRDDSDGAIV